jgi:dTDP-4-dehydrorhamnose reductase
MSGSILVLGGTGLLGHATARELKRRGRTFTAPPREAADLADLPGLPVRLDALAPTAILNLSAFTDVGAAERPENKRVAALLNAELPGALAAYAARRRIPFVHVSTDYVFDGTKRSPYVETDPVHPLQVYGATKLAGEKAVLAANPAALILRVSTLYGPGRPHRPAYVDAILAQARTHAHATGGTVSVVEPPVSSPTYAPDVAPALIDLLDAGASGIVHTVNDGAASRLELAAATVSLAGFADRVKVTARPEPQNTLARPMYSVLDTEKLRGLIGRKLPLWDDALSRYIGELARLRR